METLYGTTAFGGNRDGVVYQVIHSGSSWFTNPISYLGSDGYMPMARAVFGPDGHLYSTTLQGGNDGNGELFDLIPPATLYKTARSFWTENILHSFAGQPTDGQYPGNGDLIWDPQGNIYGATETGGQYGSGSVYEMMPSGNGYTEQILYSFPFDLSDGAAPNGVIMDANGNLFGTAQTGGLQGCPDDQDCGLVFELTNIPGVGWQEKVLYRFTGGSDGGTPYGGLVLDAAGNLYGTTPQYGDGNAGTIFELSPSGDTWIYKVLYSFSGIQRCGPWAGLTMDATGNLYGATNCTGPYHSGEVFKLTNTPNGWVYSALYDFTGGTDGANAVGTVTIDTDGTLYGTASYAGNSQCDPPYGCGTVWMIRP